MLGVHFWDLVGGMRYVLNSAFVTTITSDQLVHRQELPPGGHTYVYETVCMLEKSTGCPLSYRECDRSTDVASSTHLKSAQDPLLGCFRTCFAVK